MQRDIVRGLLIKLMDTNVANDGSLNFLPEQKQTENASQRNFVDSHLLYIFERYFNSHLPAF